MPLSIFVVGIVTVMARPCSGALWQVRAGGFTTTVGPGAPAGMLEREQLVAARG